MAYRTGIFYLLGNSTSGITAATNQTSISFDMKHYLQASIQVDFEQIDMDTGTLLIEASNDGVKFDKIHTHFATFNQEMSGLYDYSSDSNQFALDGYMNPDGYDAGVGTSTTGTSTHLYTVDHYAPRFIRVRWIANTVSTGTIKASIIAAD
jgi:hypothetical protein